MLNKHHYIDSPLKNVIVNPKQGGHLFSYNEIKDHKITLNTIRKQVQKVLEHGDADSRFEPVQSMVIQNLVAQSPSERRLRQH